MLFCLGAGEAAGEAGQTELMETMPVIKPARLGPKARTVL